MKIVKKYNLYLIEDCAHAIESKYKGKNVGTFGTFSCLVFMQPKIYQLARWNVAYKRKKIL